MGDDWLTGMAAGTGEWDDVESRLRAQLRAGDLRKAATTVRPLGARQVEQLMDRLDRRSATVLFRLLGKGVAVDVFAALDPPQQNDLVHRLQDEDVRELFGRLHSSGQARLLDEVPAEVAQRLLGSLPAAERSRAGSVLGYPGSSVGRRMSPVPLELRPRWTARQALAAVSGQVPPGRPQESRPRRRLVAAPVVSAGHRLLGMVDLSVLVAADPDRAVGELMESAEAAVATEDAEVAARRCADRRLLVLPVTDEDGRLVGMLPVGDALAELESAESEDSARAGGSEPLGRPYLSTPILQLVRSRITWLLVLAVGATLTVQVLEVFEETIASMVVLSVFVPLLIGTGGNTGNQAATTVTRAIALGDVRPRDVLRVLTRELSVGALLGAVLGLLGLLVAGLVYAWPIGVVIGLTLLTVCTLAAAVGGLMPLVARGLGVDPAVFSNPFISTLVDAVGLLVYFLIARAVLGI